MVQYPFRTQAGKRHAKLYTKCDCWYSSRTIKKRHENRYKDWWNEVTYGQKGFHSSKRSEVLQQNSYPNWNRPQWAVENIKQFDTVRFATAEQSGHSFSLSGWSHSASGNGPCSRQTTGNVRKWNIYRYIETVKRVHFRRHWGVRCIKMFHFSRLFMIDRRFGLEVHWVVREKRPLFGRFQWSRHALCKVFVTFHIKFTASFA